MKCRMCPKYYKPNFTKINKQELGKWRGVRSFAEASTLGHALGRSTLNHLLVFAHKLRQVIGDSDVEPCDRTPAEVGACCRQLLEFVQRIQPEEISVCFRIRQVIPVTFLLSESRFSEFA